jgi:arylsulfatase A-like enzyme
MISRTLFIFLHLVTVAITPSSMATLAADSRPPNVIFIIADDLGYGELGSYGQQRIHTPHLDQMAAEGMRFTQMYSGNAVCAPSRSVLMTGKHPGHTYVRDNRQWSKARLMPKLGRPEFEGQEPLPSEVFTLVEAMKGNGYTTGGFSKWGLGGPTSTGEPLKQGFDRWFGYNCQAVAHNFYPTYLWDNDRTISLNNPPFSAHDSLKPEEDPKNPQSYTRFQGKEYAPDLINEAALDFARKHKDRPFFLYWPTTAPHVALQVPDDSLHEYVGKWNDPPYPGGKGYIPHFSLLSAYAAMITRMDRDIGQMVKLISELGLERDTMFVFTSDNGALCGTHQGLASTDCAFFQSCGPLRDGKGSYYEGGIRVPCIVKWKGVIKPQSVSHRVCGFEDWFPTLLDLTGKPTLAQDLDGISFAPTLRGETQPEREFLYREFPSYGGQQVVRSGKWKMVRQDLNPKANAKKKGKVTAPRLELYDLKNDIGETKDLAGEHPEIVERLLAIAKREHQPSTVFPFPALDL